MQSSCAQNEEDRFVNQQAILLHEESMEGHILAPASSSWKCSSLCQQSWGQQDGSGWTWHGVTSSVGLPYPGARMNGSGNLS